MGEGNETKELTMEECYQKIEKHLADIEKQLAEQAKQSFGRSARTALIIFLASLVISGLAALIAGATQAGIAQPIQLVWYGGGLIIFGTLFMLLTSCLWKVQDTKK